MMAADPEQTMKRVLSCGEVHSGHALAHDMLVAVGLADAVDVQALPAVASPAEVPDQGPCGLARWLDAGFCLVLVYAPPEVALARALAGRAATAADVDAALAAWWAVNDELLRFCCRHGDRCLLVDITAVLQAPGDFLAQVAKAFDLQPQSQPLPPDVSGPPRSLVPALALGLARSLLRGRHDIAVLLRELDGQAGLRPAPSLPEPELLAWNDHVELQAELLRARQALAATTEQARAQALVQKDELAALRRLAGQRTAQLSAAVEQAALAADHAQQAEARLSAALVERDHHAAQHAQLRTRLDTAAPVSADEVLHENGLLLLELHRIHEERDQWLQYQHELVARADAEHAALAFLRRHWRQSQPEELVIDLRQEPPGRNWHAAEDDGRWAGPAEVSVLQWPALRPGRYGIRLDVVDAMHLDILRGTQLLLNGHRVEAELLGDDFPIIVHGTVQLPAAGDTWELHLNFPRVMAPSERGEADERQLAIRLRSVVLTLLEPS